MFYEEVNDHNSNFNDYEIENEILLNNLSKVSILKSQSKSKCGPSETSSSCSNLDDIDFDELDKIFDDKNSRPNRKIKKNSQVYDEDTLKYYNEYESRIEKEIENELKETFDALSHVSLIDKNKANNLINTSDYIKNLVDKKIITFQELILFVDFYELISLIENKKSNAINSLQNISEHITDDDTWSKLQLQLETTLKQTLIILDTNIDLKTLLEKSSTKDENNIEIKCTNPNFSKTFNNDLTKNKKCKNNSKIVLEKSNLINNRVCNVKNKLNICTTSKKSSNTENSNTQGVELFDVHCRNNITNLPRIRNNRKEIILTSTNKGRSLISKPELFSFNFLKNLKKSQEDEYKSNFIELTTPKLLLNENETNKKNSFIRKKIEDAVNFYKKKQF